MSDICPNNCSSDLDRGCHCSVLEVPLSDTEVQSRIKELEKRIEEVGLSAHYAINKLRGQLLNQGCTNQSCQVHPCAHGVYRYCHDCKGTKQGSEFKMEMCR